MYRITIDRDACDGVFACLVRDGRFAEDGEGLATLDTDGPTELEVDDAHTVAARFDDDRRDDAEQAAAACPLDAIHVESVEEDVAADAASGGDTEEVQP
ncbi:ferredoxin [Haloarcula sp. CBA1130]|uniref:ferredoxin n=1 Tax=unclassified Haloarcula TaxID=2624677 RepID=UPI0012452168|nr:MULTISPECIES: ferredoxin [unclassified Haloarcula]KAA9399189.1 ferredoxin [Haloarcula sp. CBA1129]KAA9403702.1 ferredoxin [Haloarcula sp. CBA1130]